MRKIICLGKPPRKHVVLSAIGFKRVNAGEVIEVNDKQYHIIKNFYKDCFKDYVEPVKKMAPKPANKMVKETKNKAVKVEVKE